MSRSKNVLLLVLFVGITRPAVAQTDRPTFEVASVKPAVGTGDFVEVNARTVIAHAARIATLVTWASDLQPAQVVVSDAVKSTVQYDQRDDIVGKADGRVPGDRLAVGLWSLVYLGAHGQTPAATPAAAR